MRFSLCLTLFCILQLNVLSYAQKISNVDYNDIQFQIQSNSSPYNYSKLLNRYKKNDTTMTDKDYHYLYYGFVFMPNYNPSSDATVKTLVIAEMDKGNNDTALKNALMLYEQDPVNLKLLLYLSACYSNQSNGKLKKAFADKYSKLIKTIYNSGDGKGVATAYVVNRISDEYLLLIGLGLTAKKQSLVGSVTDMITIDKKGQKTAPKISAVYFNITKVTDFYNKQKGSQ